MIILFANCIDDSLLDAEDRERLESVHDVDNIYAGACWIEVLDGDYSQQHSLGDFYTLEELLNGDYADFNEIVCPKDFREEVELHFLKLGLLRTKRYYSDEDIYSTDFKRDCLAERIQEAAADKNFPKLDLLIGLYSAYS